LHDPEFTHPVNMSWELVHSGTHWGHSASTVQAWNEVCAQGVELFGLPGDRYITDVTADHMTWIFRQPHDALLFKLKFSEHLC
jgi:hypothetical protein